MKTGGSIRAVTRDQDSSGSIRRPPRRQGPFGGTVMHRQIKGGEADSTRGKPIRRPGNHRELLWQWHAAQGRTAAPPEVLYRPCRPARYGPVEERQGSREAGSTLGFFPRRAGTFALQRRRQEPSHRRVRSGAHPVVPADQVACVLDAETKDQRDGSPGRVIGRPVRRSATPPSSSHAQRGKRARLRPIGRGSGEGAVPLVPGALEPQRLHPAAALAQVRGDLLAAADVDDRVLGARHHQHRGAGKCAARRTARCRGP